MKLNHLFFAILVTMLLTLVGCFPKYVLDGYNRAGNHAAIVIDGSEHFGTFVFDGKRNHLPFQVYVPHINPDLIPSTVRWHWGNQKGTFSLKGKKWPVGKVKFQCGKLRATQSHYEDQLVVEVYYKERLSRFDHNGKLHYQFQPIERPLATGTLNVVCWGKKW